MPASRPTSANRADEVEFLVDEFTELAAAEGIGRTPTAQAEFLDMDNGHYNRIANGRSGIGGKFIARVLTAPWQRRVTFEDVFRPRRAAS